MTDEVSEPTLTRPERIGVVAFFIVAIVVCIVVVGRLGSDSDVVVGPSEDRPVAGDEVPRPVPVQDAIELASSWAAEWHPEAWLILVSSQFEFPMEPTEDPAQPGFGMVMLTFAAPKDGEEWPRLSLAVSRQTGSIYFEEETASVVEPPEPVAELVADLPISAEQAFRVADEVVGTGYRDGCEESRRQVQVVLDSTDRDSPAWVVVYFDQHERSVNDIVVRIDAQTGATETEIRDDTEC